MLFSIIKLVIIIFISPQNAKKVRATEKYLLETESNKKETHNAANKFIVEIKRNLPETARGDFKRGGEDNDTRGDYSSLPFLNKFFLPKRRAKTLSKTTTKRWTKKAIKEVTRGNRGDLNMQTTTASEHQSGCYCGKSPNKHNIEIAGGEEARPNEFPWMVRIIGGCAQGLCGGSLVSPRVILTAYHCTTKGGLAAEKPCDHSDGRRKAILGRHTVILRNLWDYITIPIIKAINPPEPWLSHRYASHDFSMLILQKPAEYSLAVRPICLPLPNEDYGGKMAVAAGWGRTATPDINNEQSPVLKSVWLKVSTKKYKHYKMFGTVLSIKDNEYQDPCSGDSGGPLMYYNNITSTYTLIGTVNGNGYDCRTNMTNTFEGSDNGLWNKVTAHMDWIEENMKQWGENICKAKNF